MNAPNFIHLQEINTINEDSPNADGDGNVFTLPGIYIFSREKSIKKETEERVKAMNGR